MNLTLLTFGAKLENHYQASFAILSFLRDPHIEKVVVVTDRPEFYAFLGEHVEFIAINDNILKSWQGEHQFFWRVKMKAIETVQQRYPDQDLLYVDSDVFLATSLDKMQTQLKQGQPLMHLCEGNLSEPRSNTWKKMYRSLKGKTFSGISINENTAMWNAGVIALPSTKATEIIQLSLLLCDEICATDCTRWFVEQFAFSLALNHIQPLQPCNDAIGHYWGNKVEWNKLIADFFVNAHLKGFSVEQCIVLLNRQDWMVLPLEKKTRKTNAKLQSLVNKIFPVKNIRYL